MFSILPAVVAISAVSHEALSATASWQAAPSTSAWSLGSNWLGGAVPNSGDTLSFGASSRFVLQNDLPAGRIAQGITFQPGSPSYQLTGNSITLSGNVTNSSNSPVLLAMDLQSVSTFVRTFTMTGGGGDITLGGSLLSGGITTAGNGVLTLTGNNSGATQAITVSANTTLRIRSSTNLTNNGSAARLILGGGNLELRNNAGGNLADRTLVLTGSSLGIFVDRDISGNGSGGRFILGDIPKTLNTDTTITVGGANGFGLTTGNLSFTGLSNARTIAIDNQSAAELRIGGILTNPSRFNNSSTVILRGTGNFLIGNLSSEHGVGPNGSGSFSLVKSGNGTAVLSGVGNYTGSTSVTGGVLRMANASALGGGAALRLVGSPASSVTVAGANATSTLDLNGFTVSTDLALIGASSAASLVNSNGTQSAVLERGIAGISLTQGGSGFQISHLSQPNILTFSAGSAQAQIASLGASAATVSIANGGSGWVTGNTVTLQGGGAGVNAVYVVTASGGQITALTLQTPGRGYTSLPTGFTGAKGTAAPAFAGTGAILNFQNNFSVAAVRLTQPGAGYSSVPTLTTVAGTGFAASVTLGSLTLSGTNNVIGGNGSLTIASNTGGSAGFSKTGAGRLTLTGLNSYAGLTSLLGGTIRVGVGGTGTTGNGGLSLSSGTQLLGTGIVKGVFTAQAGSAVYSGDETTNGLLGSLTFQAGSGANSFNFQAGSTVTLDAGPVSSGAADRLIFAGNGSTSLLFQANLVIRPAVLQTDRQVSYRFLEWSGLGAAPTFNSRFLSSTYPALLLGNGDDNLGFDLPDVSASGFAWDVSQFASDGTVSAVLRLPTFQPEATSVAPPASAGSSGPAWTVPAVPSGGGIAASGVVQIGEWNRSVLPDESLTLTGCGFATPTSNPAETRVWLWNGESGGRLFLATVREVLPEMLVVSLPPNIPSGVSLLWVESPLGVSAPIALNAPEARWVGPLGNGASPGSIKRIFGRNLAPSDGDLSGRVIMQSVAGGTTYNCTITEADPYSVSFRVPAGVSSGNYTAWVHGARGGSLGWSNGISLTVQPAYVRGGKEVRLDPLGGDETARIQQAIDQANADGGTVRLGPGTYSFSKITLKSGVRLAGTNRDQCILLANGNLTVDTGAQRAALEDLTVRAAANVYVRIDTKYSGSSTGADYVKDFSIRRCNILVTPGEISFIEVNGFLAERLEVEDSIFEGALDLDPIDCWIHGNTFRGGRPRQSDNAVNEGAIVVTAGRTLGGRHGGLVIEDNFAHTPNWPDTNGDRNYNLISPFEAARRLHCGRFFYTQAWREGIKNVHIANNQIEDVALSKLNGEINKGEIILFHSAEVPWFAQVASATSDSVTIRTDATIDGNATFSVPADPKPVFPSAAIPSKIQYGTSLVGTHVVVAHGKGLGQIRTITSASSTSLTVSPSWRVIPDSTSRIILQNAYTNVVAYQNQIAGFPLGWVEPDAGKREPTASFGVTFDANVYDGVSDSNLTTRTNRPSYIAGNPFAPSFWNCIRNDLSYGVFFTGPVLEVRPDNASAAGPMNQIGLVLLGNWIRSSKSSRPAGIFRSASDLLVSSTSELLAVGCGIEKTMCNGPLFDTQWTTTHFIKNDVYCWDAGGLFALNNRPNLFSVPEPPITSLRFEVGNNLISGSLSPIDILPSLPLDEVPVAPELTPLASEVLAVSWNPLPGHSGGYRVERQMEGTTTWQTVGAVGPSVLDFVDPTARGGIRYGYRLRALNAAGQVVSSASGISSAILPPAPDASLVLYYPFEETSGSTLFNTASPTTNATTYSINGTVDSAPIRIATGRVGQAFGLDGIDRYAATPDAPELCGSSQWTLSCWVRPENIGSVARPFIVQKSAGNDATCMLQFNASGDLTVQVDTANDAFASNAVFSNNVWYHVALVFDGSKVPEQRVSLYINGVLNLVATETSSAIPSLSKPLSLGKSANTTNRFGGQLDELRIYKRALPFPEILGLGLGSALSSTPVSANGIVLADGRQAFGWERLWDSSLLRVERSISGGAWTQVTTIPGNQNAWIAPANPVGAAYRIIRQP